MQGTHSPSTDWLVRPLRACKGTDVAWSCAKKRKSPYAVERGLVSGSDSYELELASTISLLLFAKGL